MPKDGTKRIVVTVELDIDEDGIGELVTEHDEDMVLYLDKLTGMDVTVRNVLKIEEFGE